MFFHYFVFLVCMGALTFSFAGYLISLGLIRYLRRLGSGELCAEPADMENLPMVHFIIPTLNEGLLIQNKLRNTATLEYPRDRLKVWIVDGGSRDSTALEIEKIQREIFPLTIEYSCLALAGKILQLNTALEKIPEDDFVIISDADAIVHTKEAILRTVATLQQNINTGLIGGWTNPDDKNARQGEIAFWDKQNRARFLETQTYSSSIVVAPFYAFRRSLITQFPDDCVADDIYISYVAHVKKLRVLYTPSILVTELRGPKTILDVFRHKFRKTHAYTTELFRVLYRLPQMNKRLKFFYMTKIFQFFYMPWAILFLIAESISLTAHGHFRFVLFFYICLAALILVASYILKPPPGHTRGGINLISFFASLEVFLIVNLVLICNSIIFPFWSQNSNYARLGE